MRFKTLNTMPYTTFEEFSLALFMDRADLRYLFTNGDDRAIRRLSVNEEQSFYNQVHAQDVIIQYAVWLLYQSFLDEEYRTKTNFTEILVPNEAIANHLIALLKDLIDDVFTPTFLPDYVSPYQLTKKDKWVRLVCRYTEDPVIFNSSTGVTKKAKPVTRYYEGTIVVREGLPNFGNSRDQLVDTYLYTYTPDIQLAPDSHAMLKIMLNSAQPWKYKVVQLPVSDFSLYL